MNFLPNWYIKFRYKKINFIFKVIILIFIIVDTLLMVEYYIKNAEIKNIKQQIEINNRLRSEEIRQMTKINKDETYNSLVYFLNIKSNINNKVTFNNVVIHSKNLNFDASVNDVDDYIYFVQFIEKNNNCKILDLGMPYKKNNLYKFNMILEVK